MSNDWAYQFAEEKIRAARRTRAKELDLSADESGSPKLAELPESVGQLTQLQTLDLSGNYLTVLPESLGELTQLQKLNLSDNLLRALPESLGQLTQLQTLVLLRNKLTALPADIDRLSALKELVVNGTRSPACRNHFET